MSSRSASLGSEHPVPPKQPENLLIDARSLSELLGISERTVWRMLSKGTLLQPVRLGSLTRWRLLEVYDWIDAGCPPPDNKN